MAVDRWLRLIDEAGVETAIVNADAITGEYDVIAQVESGDIAGIGKLIVEKIQAAEGVFKTITCLVIK